MDRNLKTPAFRPLPEGRGLLGGYFKFAKKNCGDAMIVATVLLFPLLAVLIYGSVMYSQMADVSNIVEEAARAGARYYAANYGLINEETLKEYSYLKAVQVITGSKNVTPVKYIDATLSPNTKIGILTKEQGKYYIDGQWCIPANSTVCTEMETLIGEKVFAQGEMMESDVFKASEATTNPPETSVIQEGGSGGSPGIWGNQTVGQTNHSGPFPAAALVPYGSGPWYTEWANGFPDSGAWWIWGQPNADKIGLNGQKVTLKSPGYWTAGYDKYRLSANADDWFNVRVDVTDVLQGEGQAMKIWDWETGPRRPVWLEATARNYYGGAGFLCSFKRTGWHWPTSYTPSEGTFAGWLRYPTWTVPYKQWVTVKAKDLNGNAAEFFVQPSAVHWYNQCSFYAYPGTTYFVCLGPASLHNDVVVDILDGGVALHSDSSWSYTPINGVQYQPVNLPEKVSPDTEFTANLTATNLAGEWFAFKPDWWPNNWNGPDSWKTKFSYHWYDSGGNLVVLDGLRTGLSNNVNTGESANLNLKIKSPAALGKYRLVIDGVQEYCAWFGPVQGVNWPTVEAWIDVTNTSSYGVSYDPTDIPKHMEAGQIYNLTVKAKNIGALSWTPGVFGLAYHWYKEPGHTVEIWNGTRVHVDYTVLPDNTYTFTLPVTAPSGPGSYTLEIDMVHTGVTWFKDKGCPTLNAAVKVPEGETLKGNLIWCDSYYMVGSYIIEYDDLSLNSKLAALTGKDVILWGNYKGNAQYFRVDSVQKNEKEMTFNKEIDVVIEKDGDYAYCTVTYHYPTPVKRLLRLIKGNDLVESGIKGKAYFKLNEGG